MVIVGVILIAVAIGGGWYAWRARTHAQQVAETAVRSGAELRELADAAGDTAWRSASKVVGVAGHADGEASVGPESQVPAVWHRTRVTRRYWEMERRDRDGKTDWERVERSETVSDFSSEQPFVVDDGTGRLFVTPKGATIDGAEQVLDRFDRDGEGRGGGGGVADTLGSALTATLQSAGQRSGTIGLKVEEWVIRPGTQLYVLGEARNHAGSLGFVKPDRGRFVISTRSEDELLGSFRRKQLVGLVIAGVGTVAGLAAIVAGVSG